MSIVKEPNCGKVPYTLHTKLQSFIDENRCENRCPCIKLLKESLQLRKTIVACMEDSCIFCSVMYCVTGPIACHALKGDNSHCCKSAENVMPFTREI